MKLYINDSGIYKIEGGDPEGGTLEFSWTKDGGMATNIYTYDADGNTVLIEMRHSKTTM